eukprot:TRINITY_DN29311_c0_g1_i1.p1 TRINITY_DN29311_c0_g1~~TRINITY_DN29311_c0_g1_i1.p1  ORF type:complete len:319 (-),score=74.07 TRINITY_DN29311_c0_g1_i1:4-960(-)
MASDSCRTVAVIVASSSAASTAAGRKHRRRTSFLSCCLLIGPFVLLQLTRTRKSTNWVVSSSLLPAATAVASRRPLGVRERGLTARSARQNLLARLFRVAKANLNKVLSSWEDPEKILEQALDEMQQDLISVRQAYAEVLATQRRLMTQKEHQTSVALEWYQRAELAVKKGDDELAKEALTNRQTAVEKATDLQNQLGAMTANVDKMLNSVQLLEDKIAQAKGEKEQLIARARSAKTTVSVNEMLSEVGGSSAAEAFDRMKEKVETLESRADVSEGMLPGLTAGQGVDERFRLLESESTVDDELARLKGERTLPAASQ